MEIKPENTNLEKLLQGMSTRYFVPEYQRDYAWRINAEVDDLWNDIISSYRNDSSYFMGTIVLNNENREQEQFDIVDGQQRLATFTILFSVARAMCKHFGSNNKIFPEAERNEENKLIAEYLTKACEDRILYRGFPEQYYLKLNRKDESLFVTCALKDTMPLVDDDDLKILNNFPRIKKAKLYFFKKIKEVFFKDSDGLVKFQSFMVHVIQKLQFIAIKVKTDYDAYLLFESLNSKGLELSTADLLKNKMLMVCNNIEGSKEHVLNNWDEMTRVIKENTKYESPVDFIRFFWIAFYNKNTTKKELYKQIKKEIEKPNYNIVGFSEDLKRKAENFAEIADKELIWPSTNYETDSTDQYLAEINTLNYTICMPVLLKIKFLRPELFKRIVYNSLIYLFRVITIGEYSVGSANVVFNEMLEAVDKGKTDGEILSIFTQEEAKVSNASLKDKLKLFEFKSNNLAKYLLLKVYTFQHRNDYVPNLNELHLEHVLPQDPCKWLEEGFDHDNHNMEDWIYNIGNMLVINKKINSSIKNDIFSAKLNEYKTLEEDLMVSEFYEKYKEGQWTSSSIQERADEIAILAPQIWKFDIP